jgi:hypothetical protein
VPRRNRRPCGTATEARQIGPPTSAMKEVAKKSPAARGRRTVREETPNAGTGRRRSPPSTSTVAGRSGHVAEFQISRKPIFQTPKRSRTAAQRERHTSPIESIGRISDRAPTLSLVTLATCRTGRAPRESALRHGSRLGWKRAPVRTLSCIGLHPENLFGETVAPQPRRRRKPKY